MKKITCIFVLFFGADILVSCTKINNLVQQVSIQKKAAIAHTNDWITTDFGKSDIGTADGEIGLY